MTDPHRGLPLVHSGASLDECRAVVIMIHGRNASPASILELAPRLACADCAYLAPTAANRSWYPLSFLSELEKNEPSLTSALGVLDALVADLASKGVPDSRVVLLGFSQGGCLAAEFARRRPARYGGVVVFSGGIIGPPGTAWNAAGNFGGTPIFLGCSDVDAHVPRTRVEESAQLFRDMGAEVITRIYPGMAHVVNDDEIAHARAIVGGVAA
jgi:phospholipase/carboxylesterase